MKERLTGAIILVALMVLLVPELLTGPVRSRPRAATLPPVAGEAPLRSYTIELADEARTRNASPQASGPRQPAPLGSAAQTENALPEATGTSSVGDPNAEAPTTPATSAVGAPSGTAASAVGAPSGTATPGGEAGTSARGTPARSASAHGARANSMAPAGRGNAAGASGAWVVQIGSFASRVNAEHLAQQVRAQGFEVSVSQSSSGRHLFRVRVGAAHDRAGALALAQKLRGLGHSGTVQPRQGGA